MNLLLESMEKTDIDNEIEAIIMEKLKQNKSKE